MILNMRGGLQPRGHAPYLDGYPPPRGVGTRYGSRYTPWFPRQRDRGLQDSGSCLQGPVVCVGGACIGLGLVSSQFTYHRRQCPVIYAQNGSQQNGQTSAPSVDSRSLLLGKFCTHPHPRHTHTHTHIRMYTHLHTYIIHT